MIIKELITDWDVVWPGFLQLLQEELAKVGDTYGFNKLLPLHLHQSIPCLHDLTTNGRVNKATVNLLQTQPVQEWTSVTIGNQLRPHFKRLEGLVVG